MDTFVLLGKAFEAIKAGGALPAVLNAANEETVAAFLNKKIAFFDIAEIVCDTVDAMSSASMAHTLDEILSYSGEARKVAQKYILERTR
jgi:1-deoxy-D-xylulose-5-phosphate reductoisomerase